MENNIAFLTVHVGQNFGSNLQTIATAEVIKNTGNTPILINYCPKRVTRKHYWQDVIASPVRFIWRLFRAPFFYKNLHVYESYLSGYCDMTEPIYDEDDFIKKCPHADVYLTGSDQVWNSHHNQGLNKRYYFEGIKGKKVAYASSFGVEELPEDEYIEVKRMLASYSAISVREDSAKKLVNSMGYDAEHLIDPTFMLNKEDWKAYASARIVKEPYLLMYTPYNVVDKQLLYKSARKIAKEKGLKVVTFSWTLMSERLADKTIKFASPGDFLSLMLNADYVITNSFHGTAFSINLNKQFLVYMPSGFGTRIKSILTQFKLDSRLMGGSETELPYNDIINYNETNKILDLEREKSMNYLKKALQ